MNCNGVQLKPGSRNLLMLALLENAELPTLDIHAEARGLAGTTIPLKSLYTQLERLAAAGLITGRRRTETDGRRGSPIRRVWRLTAAGGRALFAAREQTQRAAAVLGVIHKLRISG